MDSDRAVTALAWHLRSFFKGHSIDLVSWPKGPIENVLPGFKVHRISPGPKSQLWTYVSSGAHRVSQPNSGPLEFALMSEKDNPRCVELLAMVAHYHFGHGLGVGHTLTVGEPWLPRSTCTAMLVSVPYPYGPAFEICKFPQGHVHILWLLPITEAEREFKVAHGVEKLEDLFEQRAVKYWAPDRASEV